MFRFKKCNLVNGNNLQKLWRETTRKERDAINSQILNDLFLIKVRIFLLRITAISELFNKRQMKRKETFCKWYIDRLNHPTDVIVVEGNSSSITNDQNNKQVIQSWINRIKPWSNRKYFVIEIRIRFQFVE